MYHVTFSFWKCIKCLDGVEVIFSGVSLRAFNPDITHKTSCRNGISMEHTSISIFVVLGQLRRLDKGRILYRLVKTYNFIEQLNP